MATKTVPATAVYAKTSTTFTMSSGSPVTIRKGEAWASSDPAVHAHPELFSDYPLVRVSDWRGLVAVEDL